MWAWPGPCSNLDPALIINEMAPVCPSSDCAEATLTPCFASETLNSLLFDVRLVWEKDRLLGTANLLVDRKDPITLVRMLL